jgi:hypothetical protein
MPQVEYELFAAVGRYQGKDGKERTSTRKVGELLTHSTGERFIRLDPFFNFGAVERKPGSDRIFLKMVKPEVKK